MGVGAGLSMYVVVVQKFTFAISSPDEFLLLYANYVGVRWLKAHIRSSRPVNCAVSLSPVYTMQPVVKPVVKPV